MSVLLLFLLAMLVWHGLHITAPPTRRWVPEIFPEGILFRYMESQNTLRFSLTNHSWAGDFMASVEAMPPELELVAQGRCDFGLYWSGVHREMGEEMRGWLLWGEGYPGFLAVFHSPNANDASAKIASREAEQIVFNVKAEAASFPFVARTLIQMARFQFIEGRIKSGALFLCGDGEHKHAPIEFGNEAEYPAMRMLLQRACAEYRALGVALFATVSLETDDPRYAAEPRFDAIVMRVEAKSDVPGELQAGTFMLPIRTVDGKKTLEAAHDRSDQDPFPGLSGLVETTGILTSC